MNWGLPHCRHILYHLSHQGSPKSGHQVGMRCARDLLGKCSRRSRCGWELPSEYAGEKKEVRKEDPRLPDRSKKVSAGQTGSPRAMISHHRSLESNRYGKHVSPGLTHFPTEVGSQTVDAAFHTCLPLKHDSRAPAILSPGWCQIGENVASAGALLEIPICSVWKPPSRYHLGSNFS